MIKIKHTWHFQLLTCSRMAFPSVLLFSKWWRMHDHKSSCLCWKKYFLRISFSSSLSSVIPRRRTASGVAHHKRRSFDWSSICLRCIHWLSNIIFRTDYLRPHFVFALNSFTSHGVKMNLPYFSNSLLFH